MDAKYDYISQEDRYGLGVDLDSGKHFLAIPVTIGVADYNEYYEVTKEVFAHYLADPAAALGFAEQCRLREHDELLILKPGWNRGIPI
ncbi:MAG: hypothetical protein ABIP33_02650 [Pseudolysinimonas sp.]